jgi:hypothetical protein
MHNKAIGGYFSLELPISKNKLYPCAHKYQSGRAAFFALLLAGQPSKIWIPYFICDSMITPLQKVGVEFKFYSLNTRFEIVEDIQLGSNDWLFYVNYFGICSLQQQQILNQFDSSKVIFDHSQAFFAPPLNCLATLYSPRKFFGLSDGGLLVTKLSMHTPVEIDITSAERTTHLIKRLALSPESGYADYQTAEKSLEDFSPKQMSHLTETILASIDTNQVREIRNSNFRELHQHLKHLNRLNIDLATIDGPLCYPLLLDSIDCRPTLLSHRIFVATYWPDVMSRTKDSSVEQKLVKSLLPLPCDQRYSSHDMQKIINIIQLEVNNEHSR